MNIIDILGRLTKTTGWRLVVNNEEHFETIRNELWQCPIEAVAHAAAGQWKEAAHYLNLSPEDANSIMMASDNTPEADPSLRRALLSICHLDHINTQLAPKRPVPLIVNPKFYTPRKAYRP